MNKHPLIEALERNRQKQIEIDLGICHSMALARNQFSTDAEFHQWCAGNGIDADAINRSVRSTMGTLLQRGSITPRRSRSTKNKEV